MTVEQFLQEYFNEDQMAKVLGITVASLRNRISSGKDYPPYTGRGKGRRFPIDAFKRWDKERLNHQKNR